MMRINTILPFVSAAITAVLVLPSLSAQDNKDKETMTTVAEFLEDGHMTKHPLNDEMSERAFGLYLESLDPLKLYFDQADYNEFSKRRKDIDDMMKAGDNKFAHKVFKRFLTRLDQRVEWVHELIEGDFDFDLDESFVTDRDTAKYAWSETEGKDRWRRRLKYDLLNHEQDGIKGDEAKAKIKKRYTRYNKRMHQTKDIEVISMLISAVSNSYDPHSVYFSPDLLEVFEISLRLNYQGIGARLNEEDGYPIIVSIMPGGALEKYGKIKPDDKIATVGQGIDGEMKDIVGMRLDDVVKQIKGPENTIVRLGMLSKGQEGIVIHTITRQRTELKDDAAQGEVMEVKGADGKTIKVGVIDLPSFYRDTDAERAGKEDFRSAAGDTRKLLDDFRNQGVSVVVLDLRRNGGGHLIESVELTGLFIDKGPVVSVKTSGGRVRHHKDGDANVSWTGPLVVLTSQMSASASEIVAGAIKDYERGLIVGDHSTHGKGTVQSVQPLDRRGKLGALKLTIQQFYRPSGVSTQKKGVLADVELPSLTNVMDISESDMPFVMPYGSINASMYPKLGFIDATALDRIRSASKGRIAASEDFKKLAADIDIYLELKERKTVTVNREKYLALQDRLEKDKKNREELIKTPKEDEILRDYYLDETLQIAYDYAKSLGVLKLVRKDR